MSKGQMAPLSWSRLWFGLLTEHSILTKTVFNPTFCLTVSYNQNALAYDLLNFLAYILSSKRKKIAYGIVRDACVTYPQVKRKKLRTNNQAIKYASAKMQLFSMIWLVKIKKLKDLFSIIENSITNIEQLK